MIRTYEGGGVANGQGRGSPNGSVAVSVSSGPQSASGSAACCNSTAAALRPAGIAGLAFDASAFPAFPSVQWWLLLKLKCSAIVLWSHQDGTTIRMKTKIAVDQKSETMGLHSARSSFGDFVDILLVGPAVDGGAPGG